MRSPSPQVSGGGIAFFALCPVWASYAQVVYKDGLFAAVFTLMIALAYDLFIKIRKSEKITIWQFVRLAIVCAFASLLRKNGIIAVAVLAAVFCVMCWRNKRLCVRSVGAFLAAALLYMGVSSAIISFVHADPGSSGEALSIPFQQTARYLRDHPEDLSYEEYQVIDRVIDTKVIASVYKPELSDPVKGARNLDATVADFGNYAVVWAKMFMRHPGCFISATMHNTYGYFYPNAIIDDHVDKFIFTQASNASINTGRFDFYHVNGDETCANAELSFRSSEYIPIFGLFMSAAFYVWLFLIMLGYAFSRRLKFSLAIAAPLAITVLVCLASPVNGCVRYLLPVMGSLPLLWASLHYARREKTEQK